MLLKIDHDLILNIDDDVIQYGRRASFIASSAPIVAQGRMSDGRLPSSEDPDEMPHCGNKGP